MPRFVRVAARRWIKKGRSTGGGETHRDAAVPGAPSACPRIQNENSTHIGTFNVESRLSRRMYVAPLASGIR